MKQAILSENTPTKPTILIIDDNPASLTVLTEYLFRHGFDILAARDSESGLQRAQLTQPDLILLDINLPDQDGFETCQRLKTNPQTEPIPDILKEIKEQYPDLPVILVTGYPDEVALAIKSALEINAYTCLYKPLPIDKLLQTLTLLRRQVLGQLLGRPIRKLEA